MNRRQALSVGRLFLMCALCAVFAVPTAFAAPQESPADTATYAPEKIDALHLPNAFRVTEKVVSGGMPESDAAFQQLQELGIKTIISVDGASPDVELAKKYGLRYVHLPHGYDGVPDELTPQLAKAVRDLPGPIYLHCHHGKHRSPAAAAVACVGAGLLPPEDALAVLKTAGTNSNYRGLYQAAENARPIDSKLLDALQVDFREQAKIPPMAEAMVQIEHLHDHLKKMSQNRWQVPVDHPALNAAHEALLLREQYTELLRTDVVQKRSAEFQNLLLASEKTARELEELLNGVSAERPLDEAHAAKLFAAVSKQCVSCHQTHRDVPLKEKAP